MTAPRRTNPLSTVGLDRLGLLRKHDDRLRQHLEAAEVRVVLVCGGRVCTAGTSPVLAGTDVVSIDDGWLLGEAGGVTYVAVDVEPDGWESLPLPEGARLAGLRDIAPLVTPLEGNLLATATGLATWHATHRFCGQCGTPTEPGWAGHRRTCPECGREHFPRTDPAVIVCVTHAGRILLGRNPSWPAGFASVLAGFVEPGESLEDAVVREVHEEAGVDLDPDSVAYHSSQPWPFPASIMLGFTAAARSDRLDPDPEELTDACWYSREEVTHGAIGLPPPLSISRRLVDDWLATDSSR